MSTFVKVSNILLVLWKSPSTNGHINLQQMKTLRIERKPSYSGSFNLFVNDFLLFSYSSFIRQKYVFHF